MTRQDAFLPIEGFDVTKKEIVKRISEELGLTQLQTKKIVQMTFDAIIEALVSEGRIELRNFGVFEVKKRAARKARNPRTSASVDVPEKFVVTFKPGKEMEAQVRELETMPEEEDTSSNSADNAATSARPTSPRPGSGSGHDHGPVGTPPGYNYPGRDGSSVTEPSRPQYVPDNTDREPTSDHDRRY